MNNVNVMSRVYTTEKRYELRAVPMEDISVNQYTHKMCTRRYRAGLPSPLRPQVDHDVLIWISGVENLNVCTCLLL